MSKIRASAIAFSLIVALGGFALVGGCRSTDEADAANPAAAGDLPKDHPHADTPKDHPHADE